MLQQLSPGKTNRPEPRSLLPTTPFLDREGLMSGNATGINFGDEQDWRGKIALGTSSASTSRSIWLLAKLHNTPQKQRPMRRV
jgi:hypothetical protein